MRSQRFQNRVTAGRFTLPAAILISVTCWILSAILLPDLEIRKDDYPLWDLFRDSCIPAWGTRLFSFILYSVIGYFLIGLNNAFAIIRMRASVQTAIYFLLVSVCPAMHILFAICMRCSCRSFPYLLVFPVQKLPAGQARELFVPCIRIHGNGKPALPATDILRTRILDRRV